MRTDGKYRHPHEVAPYLDENIKARMDWMRKRVNQLVRKAAPPLPKNGEVGRGRNRSDLIRATPNQHGTNADYLTARIKRYAESI